MYTSSNTDETNPTPPTPKNPVSTSPRLGYLSGLTPAQHVTDSGEFMPYCEMQWVTLKTPIKFGAVQRVRAPRLQSPEANIKSEANQVDHHPKPHCPINHPESDISIRSASVRHPFGHQVAFVSEVAPKQWISRLGDQKKDQGTNGCLLILFLFDLDSFFQAAGKEYVCSACCKQRQAEPLTHQSKSGCLRPTRTS